MKVTSSGIINGIIQPQYGGRGTQFNENNIPTYSLPFKVESVPKETVSLAIVLEDKDYRRPKWQPKIQVIAKQLYWGI